MNSSPFLADVLYHLKSVQNSESEAHVLAIL